jgi:hypothetical protein
MMVRRALKGGSPDRISERERGILKFFKRFMNLNNKAGSYGWVS